MICFAFCEITLSQGLHIEYVDNIRILKFHRITDNVNAFYTVTQLRS